VAARVRALERAGHHVDVVAIRDVEPHRRVARKYVGLALRVARRAIWALPRTRYDVVEAHIAYPTGVVAWPAAVLHRASLVLFVHGSDVSRLVRGSAIARRVFRMLVQGADAVVVNSRHMAAETEQAVGHADQRIVVISPGIDLTLVEGLDDQDRHGILFVGRLAPEKGVAMLLGSVAILAARGVNPPLRVIGGGGEDAGLRALAASLGIDVEFAGALRPEAVGAAMRRCAVLAVPSVREGLGLVALEGMAAGAIVVATRVGGLVETVVDGVTGVLAEPGDASAFADALGRGLAIAAAPDARAAMTSAARQAAATHAIERSVDATINLYRGLRHQVLPR
jgi:glycosyltransferase involved in cell wall biosynthesis